MLLLFFRPRHFSVIPTILTWVFVILIWGIKCPCQWNPRPCYGRTLSIFIYRNFRKSVPKVVLSYSSRRLSKGSFWRLLIKNFLSFQRFYDKKTYVVLFFISISSFRWFWLILVIIRHRKFCSRWEDDGGSSPFTFEVRSDDVGSCVPREGGIERHSLDRRGE